MTMAREEGGNPRGAAKKPRTDLSRRRRPHSQPDRLLLAREGMETASKNVRVFKRREMGSEDTGNGGKATPSKVSGNGKSIKKKQSDDDKLPNAKRRRQRLVVEGSDEDSEPSEKYGNGSRDSSSPSKKIDAKPAAKPAAETVAVRKSSRVVKRRTFDDEIDFDEVVKRRKKPTQQDTFKDVAAKPDNENTDSADDEHPRKKPRRGSMQELVEKPKPKGGVTVEATLPKEKPLTARQRAMQAKENGSLQEQASTSGKEELLKADSPGDSVESREKATIPLTARQRSLQACKDGDGNFGLLEFPEGLNHTDRRRKAKLTDEEKLAKKAEAANKRKLQVEKAAKEIQASAIQKILNQDSNRKKREERLQKQKQELAEERKAAELEIASNTVRWIMGPSGTTVSWAQDEFPSIFFSGPIRYPPPREKCAACDNVYKYRDSKSNLPLCSLQCYKAMQQPLKPRLEVSPAQ